jgi:peroxiredoxin
MQVFFITSAHELMHVLNDVKITIAGAIIAITHISTTEFCAEEDVSDVLNLIAERDEIFATSTGICCDGTNLTNFLPRCDLYPKCGLN